MKKVLFIALAVAMASPIQADWAQAIKAHQTQNYQAAKEHFQKLIPYGHADAAFNLALMYLQGEGVSADESMAIAYFTLAEKLGHHGTAEGLAQLRQLVSAEQLALAEQHFLTLAQHAKWWLLPEQGPAKTVYLPARLKGDYPIYPINAFKAGVVGYVNVRFLVDEQGKVATADVLDAYPEHTFNKSALRAIKDWQFEATGEKYIRFWRFDFKLNETLDIDAVAALIEQHQLWRGAWLGSSHHQFLLASLLELLDTQKDLLIIVDPTLPVEKELDLTVFTPKAKVRANFAGFVGHAEVQVAADGTITEQFNVHFAAENTLKSLIGLKLSGKPDATYRYRLSKASASSRRPINVIPIVTIPASLTSRFWWEKAARNGSKSAQRIIAVYDERWAQILIAEQDAETMAWFAGRTIINGEYQAGHELLDAAIAKDYPTAHELKKHLQSMP